MLIVARRRSGRHLRTCGENGTIHMLLPYNETATPHPPYSEMPLLSVPQFPQHPRGVASTVESPDTAVCVCVCACVCGGGNQKEREIGKKEKRLQIMGGACPFPNMRLCRCPCRVGLVTVPIGLIIC